MSAVSGGPNNDELFACALQYLSGCEYQDVKLLEETDKVKTYQCTKDNIDYFAKFTAVSVKRLRRWKLDRGEPLVRIVKDPRISKITDRAYITTDGNATKDASDAIRIAIDIFPFKKGEDLWFYIDKNGPLKMDEVLRFAIPIAEQILSLHQKHIVHRDIKSANILIDENGHPHLADHAFAKNCDTDEPLTPIGTDGYMAPENYNISLQNKDLYKLDSYSFGVMLYEMIAKGCFSDQVVGFFNAGRIQELPLTYLDKVGCDEPIKKLINGLLKKNPGDRMSMSNALQELRAHQERRAAAKSTPDEKE